MGKPLFNLSYATRIRVIPFVIFAGLTMLQGKLGAGSEYWLYLVKTLIGACCVVYIRPRLQECKLTFTPTAVATGVLVFVIWVGLDWDWTRMPEVFNKLGLSKAYTTDTVWNPFAFFGGDSWLGWTFTIARILGSTIVVPPLEEVFYRSFLYRFFIHAEIENVPLGRFHLGAFLFVSLVFGLAHREWVAGIICGMVYQWLVIRRGHLGEAVAAHAVTNFCLGLWVVWQGAWRFW